MCPLSMALRSSGRKLSFNILSESSSVEEDDFLLYQSNMDPIEKISGATENPNRKKKRHRKKKTPESYSMIPEHPITHSGFIESNSAVQNGNVFLDNRNSYVGGGSVVCTVSDVTEDCQSMFNNSGSELRQRNVSNGGGGEEIVSSSSRVEENGTVDREVEVSSTEKHWSSEPNGSIVPTVKLETAESLDWNRLMAEDPNCKLTAILMHYSLCILLFYAVIHNLELELWKSLYTISCYDLLMSVNMLLF